MEEIKTTISSWLAYSLPRVLGYVKTTDVYMCPVNGYKVGNYEYYFKDKAVETYPNPLGGYRFVDYAYIGPYNFWANNHTVLRNAVGPLNVSSGSYSNGVRVDPSRDVLLVDKASTPVTGGYAYPITGHINQYHLWSNHKFTGNHVFTDGHGETVPFKQMRHRYHYDDNHYMKY